MDKEQFFKSTADTAQYVAEFFEDNRKLPAYPTVKPGYMRQLVPNAAPEDGESWDAVFKDIERVVIPGVLSNFSPANQAYYPLRTSYPSLIGGLLTDTFTMVPGTWEWSPAGTELEVMMMDWLGKMLHLPSKFLTDSGGSGGGVLQSSGSEATLMALLSARTRAIRQYQASHPGAEDGVIVSKMVAYCSEEVCATLGTTGQCSFDNLPEIGRVCDTEDVWLHVDAAYAGNYAICPEFRPLLDGVQFARTLVINVHKSLYVSYGCSALWIDDVSLINDAFQVNPTYMNPGLEHNRAMPSFRDVLLAKLYETLIGRDPRFEIVCKVVLGVVCFRLKRDNDVNSQLLKAINTDGRIYVGPTVAKGIFYLRLVIRGYNVRPDDIEYSWKAIQEAADKLQKEIDQPCSIQSNHVTTC